MPYDLLATTPLVTSESKGFVVGCAMCIFRLWGPPEHCYLLVCLCCLASTADKQTNKQGNCCNVHFLAHIMGPFCTVLYFKASLQKAAIEYRGN